jgi:hypothetical protein
MRILRRIPKRQLIHAGIVLGERGTWFDRIRHQPVVDDIEFGDVLGGVEGRIDSLRVAERPLVNRVLRCKVVNLWA